MWMRVSISSAFLHPMTTGVINPLRPYRGSGAEAFTAAGPAFKIKFQRAISVPPEIFPS